MGFNTFLAHAKKVNGMPLDTLAKEVGAHMVLYPETGMKVIEKALALIECPEGIRWDFLSASLNEGVALDMAVVVSTSPWCLKLLGDLSQVKEDMDCNRCQLCAKNRKAVIIFGVHGNASKKASKVIMMKKAH